MRGEMPWLVQRMRRALDMPESWYSSRLTVLSANGWWIMLCVSEARSVVRQAKLGSVVCPLRR